VLKADRVKIREKLKLLQEGKKAIIATSAGVGITAKCQQAGGSDLILVDISARMRMAGFSSMAGFFAARNSNKLLTEQATEILPLIQATPALAGVAAGDPFQEIEKFLKQLAELGFSGVCNSPSLGWHDDFNAANLRTLGIGYEQEVEMLRLAKEMNLFTLGICYSAAQAKVMADAGVDGIVANLGLTAGGLIGAHTVLSPDDALRLAIEIAEAAKTARRDIFVLCTGAHLNSPAAVKEFLNSAGVLDGFCGGSATDRIPMEKGIVSITKSFKEARLYKSQTSGI